MPRLRTSLRSALAAALMLTGSLVLVAPAGAGATGVEVTPLFTLEQPTFGFTVTSNICVAETEVTVDGIPDATTELTDPNNGRITIPVGIPGGSYDLTLSCDDGKGTFTTTGFLEFHRVTIEKVVTGTAPALGGGDAQFLVNITCSELESDTEGYGPDAEADGDPFMNADLSFDATGGSTTLVGYQSQSCDVFEVDDGGATTVSVVTQDCAESEAATEAASGSFDVFAPIDCLTTVTNDFAVAPAPVTQAQPAFTG